jgi:hypothetical protein
MEKKITLKNIIAYIQGNIRYQLYYSKFNWLISANVREQIKFRINTMEKKCYDQGSCIMCGCTTTALQMANKSCDKPCYPPIMKWNKWLKFISEKPVVINGNIWQKKTITNQLQKNVYSISTYIFYNDKLVHEKRVNYIADIDPANI